MFQTVIHQTLQNKKNIPHVEANGPFPVADVSTSFLGAGHYFWDNHIELAHFWGRRHCGNDYYICQCEMEVDKNDFFDLVGSREDQINFQSLVNILGVQHMSIGSIIELLKDMEAEDSGVFPYKAIRAADNSVKLQFDQEKFRFQNDKAGFTILSPMYIICLIDKNELILPPYKVIYST